MRCFAVDFKGLTVRGFQTTKLANSVATESESVVATATNIKDLSEATIAACSAMWNKYAEVCSVKPRSKFDNRTQASEAMLDLFETMVAVGAAPFLDGEAATQEVDTDGEVDPNAAPSKARKQPAERKASAPKAAGGTTARGKRSLYAGRILVPTEKALKENYRRQGVAGWYSLEVVRAHPEGIPFEEYLVLAGDNAGANHIKWDEERGGLTVRNA